MLFTEPSQPPESEWKFIDELREPEIKSIDWLPREIRDGEVSLNDGVTVVTEFPDADCLLDTAYADMSRFMSLAGITEANAYRIVTTYAEMEKESYRIEIGDTECQIIAGDTEGVRRGIFYIQNQLLQAGGSFLTKGNINRTAIIKNRISRCFFGPLKRPPKYKDELLDDINYYPDEYLNRLAHEGINGLWISISFKDLAKTDVLPHGEHIEQRMNKLRQTIAQCRRYGIKIYLFCTEPLAFDKDDPILKKHPELGGTTTDGKICFCPVSETSQTYLKMVMKNIFSNAPGLGGMIVLSVGEWLTLCTNAGKGQNNCPHCSKVPPWETLALSLSAMKQGMQDAAPESELISWPYTQPGCWGIDESIEAAAHVPDNVSLMHNFESFGSKIQLGKERNITDYWLSYIGPSNFFKSSALEAKENRTSMFAKLQVGCSHEVATTQYVPVPGNLYKKYKAMHELGVSGVMQCWYFGAYPCLMTKAAGELAFEPFPESEDDFLLQLAKTSWGENAADVVKAWKYFADAYSNYPLSNPLGYIGPMHDGITWPLYLEPVNRRLAPTWEIGWPTPGDRIGECLSYSYDLKENDFTMADMIVLLEKLCREWDEGVAILNTLEHQVRGNERMREIGVAKSLGILFRSGLNIFRFYKLREELAESKENSRQSILDEMEQIVVDEIAASKQMLILTINDSSLGFHSEAEGYKFHPEKLKDRIKWLENSLVTEFPRIKERIQQQLVTFPKHTGQEPQGKVASGLCTSSMSEQTTWNSLPQNHLNYEGTFDLTFEGAYPNISFNMISDKCEESYWQTAYTNEALAFNFVSVKEKVDEKFKLEIETDHLCWHDEIVVSADGKTTHNGTENSTIDATIIKENDSLNLKLTIPFSLLKLTKNSTAPIKINIVRIYTDAKGVEIHQSWVMPQPLKLIFVLGHHNPADFGWIRATKDRI